MCSVCCLVWGLWCTYLHSSMLYYILGGWGQNPSYLFIQSSFGWDCRSGKNKAGSADGLMFRGIFGPFSVAQKAFTTLFLLPPRTGPALAQSPAVCGSQAEMKKQTHTHTHPHTPSLAVVWILEGRCWILPIKQGGWMGDRRNEWGAKSSTLTALFILHAHTPIQDICDANSAQESKLCLLGSSLCVCVCGCKWVRRYLCAIYPLSLSLFRLLSLSPLSFKKFIPNTTD